LELNFLNKMKLKRYQQNPVIKPSENNKWESRAVFNCGVVYKNDLIHLLYRAIGKDKNYISRLGHAMSKDGINFKRNDKPIFEPIEKYEKWACEDPRITEINGTFYITYVALSKPAREGGGPPRTALASTIDFINFERHGIITPKGADNRDAVLFPEKINGKYVILHRPHNWTKKDIYEKKGKMYLMVKEETIEWPLNEKPDYFPEKPSIWVASSNNLKDWTEHKVIMESQEDWESIKIGAGPPPVKTDKGWLLIYHGVGYDNGIKKYKSGAALLDLKNPSKVIARTKEPILEPEEDYEIFGDVPNVVFPEGAIVKGNELFVYYGAADKTCCLATCNLEELVNFIYKL